MVDFVHNPEGYIRYLTPEECYPFYYIKDLLDNVRETYVHPSAGYKECVQRTQYYPSGLPWAEAMVPAEQPWKYNSKEFVEMHGLDEYDYGFRFYYPSIGRFTTIDPLSEYTPTQSPYIYANNNWSNQIDFMGLMGHRTNFTVLDSEGDVVFHEDNGDYGVYQLKEGQVFDKDKTDRSSLTQVGWEIPGYIDYRKNHPCYYLGSVTTTHYSLNGITITGRTALMYGNTSVTNSIDDSFAALYYYFFGCAKDKALGDFLTRKWLMNHPNFNIKYSKILTGAMPSSGNFPIDMTKYIFHIGRTNVYYYTTESYSVFSIGFGDGFWDPLSLLEKSERNPYGIKPDGKGWLLEVGIPYNYIPTAILIPHQH